MKRRQRFQSPPEDPRDSSLAFRLNLGFFARQLGIFLVMDILVVALSVLGLTVDAEKRCGSVAQVVQTCGFPDEETIPWLKNGEYMVVPLDRPPQGMEIPKALSWLSIEEGLEQGLRRYERMRYYVLELPNGGEPYAIRVDMNGVFHTLRWVMIGLMVCQAFSLVLNLFRNYRSIRQVLRPIEDLATATERLHATTQAAAGQEVSLDLESMTDKLGQINAKHLDSRIDLPSTQKELRSLAQAINAMLERVDQAYSVQMRFVSDASHELRTPIAVIQGYANLLDRWGKSDPEALEESITAIRDEAESMERLVEQLLFLARGDNDSQPVKLEWLDLTNLAGEVLREETMIHPERAILPRWQSGDVVPVLADPCLIKQLMRILLDNSLKYSPEDSRVYLRVTQSQGHARVTVQDEGMGIAPEALPHIFERFYRTDRSRARKTGGTGLGLSIAKWIVDRHGGWFEVVSRMEVGTRITFVLPLTETAPPPNQPES